VRTSSITASIQGRGEFVPARTGSRGADYVDVARLPQRGVAALMRSWKAESDGDVCRSLRHF